MQIKGNFKTRDVWVDGKRLNVGHSQKVYNHSPDGFMWGYGGSGPSQLALAILLEIMPEEKALKKYQNFKHKVIANIPQGSDFEMIITKQLKVKKMEVKYNLTEKVNHESEQNHCTKGHEHRCHIAGGTECKCSCGGGNHGKQPKLFN